MDLPLNESRIKKRYRELVKKFHPDLGGDPEKFKKIQETYEFLTSLDVLCSIAYNNDDDETLKNQIFETVDGIPLSELGLGLGPTVNGRNCEECEHRGYKKEHGRAWKVCTDCDENGLIPREFPCRSCGASGKFKTKRGFIVPCKTCSGTGIFKHPHQKMLCRECHGTKTIYGESESFYYVRCSRCGGSGEIEIDNPVIPKGRLAYMFS